MADNESVAQSDKDLYQSYLTKLKKIARYRRLNVPILGNDARFWDRWQLIFQPELEKSEVEVNPQNFQYRVVVIARLGESMEKRTYYCNQYDLDEQNKIFRLNDHGITEDGQSVSRVYAEYSLIEISNLIRIGKLQ